MRILFEVETPIPNIRKLQSRVSCIFIQLHVKKTGLSSGTVITKETNEPNSTVLLGVYCLVDLSLLLYVNYAFEYLQKEAKKLFVTGTVERLWWVRIHMLTMHTENCNTLIHQSIPAVPIPPFPRALAGHLLTFQSRESGI